MATHKGDTAQSRARIVVHSEPAPTHGQTLYDREIPSDIALITPLVVRALEFLKSESLIIPGEESRVGLCIEEALQNAVKHGNKGDFRKKVRLQLFLTDTEWGAVVSDEGSGFDLNSVRDPLQSEGVWGESGRGLYLISHFMDRVEYYSDGSTLVLARHL